MFKGCDSTHSNLRNQVTAAFTTKWLKARTKIRSHMSPDLQLKSRSNSKGEIVKAQVKIEWEVKSRRIYP